MLVTHHTENIFQMSVTTNEVEEHITYGGMVLLLLLSLAEGTQECIESEFDIN